MRTRKHLLDDKPIYYVYVLFDWLGVPFYVGKGCRNRIEMHEKRTDPGNPLKNEIIEQTYTMLGEVPKMLVQENLPEKTAFKVEIALIGAIGRLDLGTGPLVNLTSGGDGGRTPSDRIIAGAKRAYKELGEEWLSERARRIAEALGEEGRRQRALKGSRTLGKEGRRARRLKADMTLGKEGTKARSLKAAQSMSLEARKARTKKANETLGPEGRKARSRKRLETMTPEQRHESAKLGWANMTEEGRKERGRKIWEARRAKYGTLGYSGGGYKKKSSSPPPAEGHSVAHQARDQFEHEDHDED